MQDDDNLYYNIKNKKSNNSFVAEPSKFIHENSGDRIESYLTSKSKRSISAELKKST
jgi:hypothetical protein